MQKKIFYKSILSIILIINFYPSFGQSTEKYKLKDQSWKKLSLREKIGQTVIIVADPAKHKELHGDLKSFLKKYPVGGIFIGGEVIKDATDEGKSIFKAVKEYNEAAKNPLIFCGDMEAGVGSNVRNMTMFPHLMALGAGLSKENAYNYGKATAFEANSLGVKWIFSPVTDLNQNPLNPIVNIRGISDNPETTINLLTTLIKGMQENNLASTLKHFPGDGLDYRDQHLKTTTNPLTIEAWKENHGKAFQELINQGAYSIMTGHINFPAYQSEKEKRNEQYLPASLSYELTTNLLKKEMNFQGVVVSDALMMGGFKQWYDNQIEAEIECFKAGNDMLLWPTYEYFDEMEKAISSEKISMERLDDAVRRVWELKEKMGILKKNADTFKTLNEGDLKFIQQTAKAVADRSITLLADKKKLLPLDSNKVSKVLLVGITPHTPDFNSLEIFKKELESRGIEVSIQRNIWYKQLDQVGKDYDFIIYLLSRYPHRPMGPLSFWGNEAAAVWSSLSNAKEKSIIVSLGSPYHFVDYYQSANIFINAYSIAPESQKAVVRAIFGEIPFVGVSPVKISFKF